MKTRNVKLMLDALLFGAGLALAFGLGTFMRNQADTVVWVLGSIVKLLGFLAMGTAVYRAFGRFK